MAYEIRLFRAMNIRLDHLEHGFDTSPMNKTEQEQHFFSPDFGLVHAMLPLRFFTRYFREMSLTANMMSKQKLRKCL